MQRVPEALQFPVVVKGRRPPPVEPQPLEKSDFALGRAAAEGGILEKFVEAGFFAGQLAGFPLDELESFHISGDDPGVQDDIQSKGREVDVPGFDQRLQERDALFPGQMENVGIEELEDDDAHLLEASAAEVRDHAEPVFVAQLFLGHGRDHVQQPLGDEPLQLAEGLRSKIARTCRSLSG